MGTMEDNYYVSVHGDGDNRLKFVVLTSIYRPHGQEELSDT